jgi:hypothetical protein
LAQITDFSSAWPALGTRILGDDGAANVSPTLFSVRGQKFKGVMPLTAMSGAPTITSIASDTTTIPSAVQVARTSGAFRYPGTPVKNHGGVPTYYTVSFGGSDALSHPWIVEFWSDAPKLALRVWDANAAYYVHILVDKQLAHSAPVAAGGGGSSVANLVEIDWGGVAKPRLYRIALKNTLFGGVYVGATDSVWFPSAQRKPVMCAFGDSYGDTFPTTGPGAQASLFAMIAWALDFEHWNMNVWGSGYIQGGGYNIPGMVTNRLGLLTQMPDVILFAGGYNDSAQPQATIGTNAASAFASAKQLAPKAKILVLGPWTPRGESFDANLATTKATVSNAALAAGLPFIDISQIVTAGNKARYTRADNTHPTDADGHPFLASRIGPLIHAALAA